jgi:hypothetical protein
MEFQRRFRLSPRYDGRIPWWDCLLAVMLLLAACNFPTATPAGVVQNSGETATSNSIDITDLLSPSATPTSKPEPGIWGRLANPGFENQRIITTLFFSGQARDGSKRYECRADPNLSLFTVHPSDERHLNWSMKPENRTFALTRMTHAGINVVTMSSWGEDFLPCGTGWSLIAPMQTAPGSQDELFTAALEEHLLVMPLIESRNDWAFRDEFPRLRDGRVAPGTVSQIVNLIERYLHNDSHPEWAEAWAKVYDHNGEARFAVSIIHASSNVLSYGDHAGYAAGFDVLAEEVLNLTGVQVGFFIDPLPPNSNAPGEFKPYPEKTGPSLIETDAILGIQSFIPEIWISGNPTESQQIAWKRDYSQRWSETGVPFLMDVSPGYDARIVFPGSIQYGFTATWLQELTEMVADFGEDGLTFNSWNGYTEGMAAVATREYEDQYYQWLQELSAMVRSKE